jgi:hypothetical protein
MKKTIAIAVMIIISIKILAQYPSSCGLITNRNNSNGQANSCAGVSGTAIASNCTGGCATVPAGSKTADIIFKYDNTNYLTLKPFSITKISQTINGVTTQLSSMAGPPSVPTVTGSVDALVKYCVYGTTNLPTSGTLLFELTDPETGDIYGACMYDASCNSNCVTTGFVLPVIISNLNGSKTAQGNQLRWSCINLPEVNSFYIQKSTNGRLFETITEQKPGTGNSANYSYTDKNCGNNLVFYRVKIVQTDGSSRYSNIVQIKNDALHSDAVQVLPNPFTDRLTIKTTMDKPAMVLIQLLDINGKQAATQKVMGAAGENIFTLNRLGKVSRGLYILKLSTTYSSSEQRIVRQ